jgi:hypothetical protein
MSRYLCAPGHHTSPSTRTIASTPVSQQGPSRLRVLRESLVILFGALLYFWVRGIMETRAALAFANADILIALEERLGISHEAWLQALIVDSDRLITLFNRIYIFGHWPVIILTMFWLVWRHSHHFPLYRSALLISGAIGLVWFVLFPMAPPRLVLELGFVDTVTQQSEAYRLLQPPAFTNQYAAMPSLHVGWNLLMGIAIVRHSRHVLARAFGVLMPMAMFLATITTANHFILDGIVGSLVALIGLTVAWRISRPTLGPTPVHDGMPPPSRTLGQGWNHRPAA